MSGDVVEKHGREMVVKTGVGENKSSLEQKFYEALKKKMDEMELVHLTKEVEGKAVEVAYICLKSKDEKNFVFISIEDVRHEDQNQKVSRKRSVSVMRLDLEKIDDEWIDSVDAREMGDVVEVWGQHKYADKAKISNWRDGGAIDYLSTPIVRKEGETKEVIEKILKLIPNLVTDDEALGKYKNVFKNRGYDVVGV